MQVVDEPLVCRAVRRDGALQSAGLDGAPHRRMHRTTTAHSPASPPRETRATARRQGASGDRPDGTALRDGRRWPYRRRRGRGAALVVAARAPCEDARGPAGRSRGRTARPSSRRKVTAVRTIEAAQTLASTASSRRGSDAQVGHARELNDARVPVGGRRATGNDDIPWRPRGRSSTVSRPGRGRVDEALPPCRGWSRRDAAPARRPKASDLESAGGGSRYRTPRRASARDLVRATARRERRRRPAGPPSRAAGRVQRRPALYDCRPRRGDRVSPWSAAWDPRQRDGAYRRR